MSVSVLFAALLPLLALASGKNAGDVNRQPDFDAGRYLGRWYEIARTKNMPFEFGTDTQANYALNPNGTVAVYNVEWRRNRWSGAHAVATIVDNARLSVDFFHGPPGDYQVLQTDYDTYSVVYSYFRKFGPLKIHFGWILSRTTSLPQDVIDKAFQLFEQETGLKQSQFHMTKQGVAPYPPPAGY